jgi:hypothetical protein
MMNDEILDSTTGDEMRGGSNMGVGFTTEEQLI